MFTIIGDDDSIKNNKKTMAEQEDIDFIQIDHKNSLTFIDFQEVLFKLLTLKEEYSENLISSDINQFIAKVLPNYNKDYFTISNGIKKQYLRENKLSKPQVESCINYFESHRIEGSTTFVLTKENIQNLGNLIAYGYKKFDCFKTKSEKDFLDKVNQIKQKDIDVIEDYNSYLIKEKPKKVLDKTEFWRKHRSNYPLPPEFIFIMHYFRDFTNVEICLESYTNNDLRLLLLIYLNFESVFQNVKKMKVDFSNDTCLKLIYERLQFHLNKKENQKGRFVKRINYREEFSLKHHWNFSSNYITSCEDENLSLTSSFKTDNDAYSVSRQSIVETNTDLKQKIKTLEIIKNDQFLFEAILITPFFLTKYANINNMTLIFSDFFTREVKWLFKDFYNLNIINFHLLNTFTSQLAQLSTFNVEFNSLNPQGFEKIIAIIDKNQKLSTLRLSLFNSDVNYLPAGLFKLSEEVKLVTEELFDNKRISAQAKIDGDDSEHVLISLLLQSFEENLSLLFSLIRKKESLREIAIILDSPSIISSNENYSMTLMKFFFNMILFLNTKACRLETIKFLSPYLAFDNRRFPGIQDFLDEINIQENNSVIKNIYIQLQLYETVNITNLISTNLINITIGDFDEITFTSFTKYITSKVFRTQSKLKTISIGLLSIVTNLVDVKENYEKITNIYIPTLESFIFHSHLIITKEDYQMILAYLNCSFIKSFLLEFNIRARDEIQSLLRTNKQTNALKVYNINVEDKESAYSIINSVYMKLKKKVKRKPRIPRNRICEFLYKKEKTNVTEQYN